jgi:thiosulfate reductase cytochrome b subunit
MTIVPMKGKQRRSWRMTGAVEAGGGDIVYRHRRATRLWHWLNALAIFVMLMSGMMIFNAHPRLYWGRYGANFDRAWLEIGNNGSNGYLRVVRLVVPTGRVLGRARLQAFPPLVTIPSSYDLAGARQWHFAFAWLLVVPGLAYWLWSVLSGHLRRDLAPSRGELAPSSLWHSISEHARLRFPAGVAAQRYNVLQKLSYLIIVFGLLPIAVLTGMTMSPALDAAWPWLPDLFGGRQSARSIHFLAAVAIVAFILVHLAMVVLAGPLNEVRSMITGRYRLPRARAE